MTQETPSTEVVLNGLHRNKLESVLASMKDPGVLQAVSGPWKARVVWQQGFRTKTYLRKHVVEMDEPSELEATDAAASAHEQLLAAIGSCLTVGFVLNATRRGIRVHDLEIALEGHFDNILKWAGYSFEGNPGYRGITAKLYVKADADPDTLREIWRRAVEGSPVTQTVVRGTPVHTEFEAV